MFNTIITQLLAILNAILLAAKPELKTIISGYLEGFKTRIQLIADNKADLSPDDLKQALQNEISILKIELLTVEQFGAQYLQDAINAAIDFATQLIVKL